MKAVPEILAPAGNLSCLKSAVSAGADAVYFGGQAFNARRGAGNFTAEDIREAVRLCRMRGVKTNLTLNTLVKEKEWPELLAYMDEVLPLGIDAVIVQDLGVARQIHQHYPQIALHGSTQMAVQDLEGVLYLKKLGFSRVVLAREVTLEEIRRIHENTDTELEVFVHGALCYSYSGRCLMSSFHGGRSGNRGACAQPCRLPYQADGQKGYFMNLKDLCGAEHLEKLIQAGAISFKIEGRLKGEAYVAGVTSYYRRLMDEYLQAGHISRPEPKDQEVLRQLFNRGGFTSGYYLGKDHMIERATPKHQGILVGRVVKAQAGHISMESDHVLHSGDELEIRNGQLPYPSVRLAESMLREEGEGHRAEFYLKGEIRAGQEVWRVVDPVLQQQITEKAAILPKVPIDASFEGKIGKPCCLSAQGQTVLGAVVSQARSRSLTIEEVRRQLVKTGDTGYEIQQLHIDLEEGSFLPVSALNQLRRELLERLSQVEPWQRQNQEEEEDRPIPREKEAVRAVWLGVNSPRQWQALASMDHRRIAVLFPRMEGFAKADKAAFLRLAAGKKVVPSLPPVGRMSHRAWIRREIEAWQALGIRDFEANLIGQAELIEEMRGRVWAGPHLSVMNRAAAAFWQRRARSVMLSWELTGREMRDMGALQGAYYMAYGRVPYMISEQCVYKERHGCQKAANGHLLKLRDRKGEEMTVCSHCELCYSEILSEQPVDLLGRKEPQAYPRLELTLETEQETKTLWESVLSGQARKAPGQLGHWEKGVE